MKKDEALAGEAREPLSISVLQEANYGDLAAIHDGFTPDPRRSVTLIAKEGERITGRIFLLAPTHIEGPWVEESRRGGTLAKRLMDAAEYVAKAHGISKLLAYATNDELAGYLKRLGYSKWENVTVWMKEI